MKRIIIYLIITLFVFNVNSYATNTTSITKSTAQLLSSCTISATNFDFGTLTAGVQNATSGNFNSLCTKGTAYTLKFGWGGNIGTAAQCNSPNPCPRMARSDSTDYIPYYILLLDNYHAAGDGYYGNTYSATGTGSVQTLTLNAKQWGNFYPKPGNYSDTVIVSINY